ncbi:hypothetical protein ACERK3_01895 [Phycisphaerales bacterium AB-hyl4]|uniref:Outer membrane lipoprotein-sorting protein n=1 Tax=Natronomicrosphaera hydrolytica TaxID=3242702 RepID=A0ABV4U0Y9_9BACT
MTWRHCLGCLTALALLLALTPAHSRADDSLLADERWSESAFGLSLRPPAGSTLYEQTADRAIATFLVDDDMSIRVHFRQAEERVTLDLVRQRAAEQFTFYYPAAVVVEDDVEEIRIADRRGARWYFLVPGDEGQWVAGQAFVMIDPFTVAMFQYESDAHSYERSRRIFEAVLDSVELMPPDELDRQRTALIEAGDAWLAEVDFAAVEGVLPERQFMRVIEGDTDVGYQRIVTEHVENLGEAGVEVRIQARDLVGDGHAYDSQSELFLGEGEQTELWSSVTTLRPKEQPQQPAGLQSREQLQPQHGTEQTWTDTGLRSHNRISVSQEGPTQIESRNWEVPPKAYASQVVAQATPALMAKQAAAGRPPAAMAFYAYHPSAGRLMLRAVRIEPSDDGGWRVYDRPAPDRAEQVFHFDAEGQLIEHHTGDGRVSRPATEDEIRAVWGR